MPSPGSAGRWPATTSSHTGWQSRGYLPHFDAADFWQIITYRLADSLPREVIAKVEYELSAEPDDVRAQERRRRLETYLDGGLGSCVLRDSRVAQIVIDNWHHFHGQRYELGAWVVMPNHVHVLIKVLDGHPLGGIVQSWKSFTAKQISATTGHQPPIWQAEYWDRFIRDEAHFMDAVRYIGMNPVMAGLTKEPEEWRWGSVGYRPQTSGECGPAARAPGKDITPSG